MSAEPFGRQPKPVNVKIRGETSDVEYWLRELRRRAGFKGDDISGTSYDTDGGAEFTIYPRAVNE